MLFNAPIAVPKAPGECRALWRRLFMEAIDVKALTPDSVSNAFYAVALLSATPLIRVVDALVELGLRAPVEAFPKPWLATMRGRVLDLGEREMLSHGLAGLVASWGWMLPPLPRLTLPLGLDSELDPYGCDLLGILGAELGQQPRFGYTPARVRLALLRTALCMGRPLAHVVSELVERGVVLTPESVPAGCREVMRLTATHPLVREQVASWQVCQRSVAEVIPLRRAR